MAIGIDEPWVILTGRYGGDVSSPRLEDLDRAIEELYVEHLPGMTEWDYEEHGAASLRTGFDDGPMYVLEVTRGGIVRFDEWADQDFETSLSPTKVLQSVPREHALQLWRWLVEGAVQQVRGQNWLLE